MTYDVVVVGGGIGGLTIAALLSVRGVRTGLLERQSQVGGCIGRVEFSGYAFEPGIGLYVGFGRDETYSQIFSELKIAPPAATSIESDYVVRMVDGSDVHLNRNDLQFYENIRAAFPESADAAVEFYETVKRVSELWKARTADEPTGGMLSKAFKKFRSKSKDDEFVLNAATQTAVSFAGNTSKRFQQFINAQLGAVLQSTIDRCAFLPACLALSLLRGKLYSIEGGTAGLAERVEAAIKLAGGTVRLNSPVLRLAYNESGDAIGVDLLSGERVIAKHAIVSNLTVWDTYGKLVGLNRTSAATKARLANYTSSGSYIIYATVEETTAQRLPAPNFLVVGNEPALNDNLSSEFTVTIGPVAKDGKHPTTIKTTTEITQWFAFQTSEEDFSARDQQTLEQFWEKLHNAVPELGSGIEVIETANPRTFFDTTRRKLGMVMGIEPIPSNWPAKLDFTTEIPNLFIVGDTICPTFGISEIARASEELANLLTKT